MSIQIPVTITIDEGSATTQSRIKIVSAGHVVVDDYENDIPLHVRRTVATCMSGYSKALERTAKILDPSV